MRHSVLIRKFNIDIGYAFCDEDLPALGLDNNLNRKKL